MRGDITPVEKLQAFAVGVYWPLSGDFVRQGWHGDDYLILFNDSDASAASDSYAISQFLPGYKVIGPCGWDDFIPQDSSGATYCVPTVPAVAEHVSVCVLSSGGTTLNSDDHF